MNRESLFSVLRPIVLQTGVPEVVLLDENADPPTGAYASIEPFSAVAPRGQGGLQYSRPLAGDLDATVSRVWDVTAAANFYRGDDPTYLAALLIGRNEIPTNSATLMSAGVRWVSAGPATDLTDLLSGGHRAEKRARIEIKLQISVALTATVPAVLSAGDIEVEDEHGTILLNAGG